MVIAPEGFRDEEYSMPREVFEKSGFQVKIASTVLGKCRGKLGLEVKSELLLKEAKVEDYDAVVFVGGRGASVYFNDVFAHNLAKEFFNADKIVSAICIAPMILANAGLLKNKKATVFISEASNIQKQGAVYTGKPVEQDGNIITASGPDAAQRFGETIINLLKV